MFRKKKLQFFNCNLNKHGKKIAFPFFAVRRGSVLSTVVVAALHVLLGYIIKISAYR